MKPPPSAEAQVSVVTGVGRTVFAGESGVSACGTLAAGAIRRDPLVGAGAVAALPPGGRYVEDGELGSGGMGRVALVFDRVLGRQVAEKEILSPKHAPLLVNEARVCAQLEHPAIVPLYDLAVGSDGLPRYTMRVVRGESLAYVLARESRPLAQLLRVVVQVCLAVDYAHSRGVVHRDLKPANILVGSFGEVYVLDWGIAHVMPDSDLFRGDDWVEVPLAGTPAYMSPEQLDGVVSPAADVYALGAILFEVLVGRQAFPEATDVPSIRGRELLASPSRSDPVGAVPSAFDELVARCLSRDPSERPKSVRAIADAVDAYLDGERERAERLREAEALCDTGDAEWRAYEARMSEATELAARAKAGLTALAPHDPVERKRPVWELGDRARQAKREAASALSNAEIAFTEALGRARDHVRARAGLCQLHLAQLREAERARDEEAASHHLQLARSFDDGRLARELSETGELTVTSSPDGAQIELRRYEPKGPLLTLSEPRDLGWAPTRAVTLPAGSYLVVGRREGREVRYPLVVERACRHALHLRIPGDGEIPDGFVLVPGGPFRALDASGDLRTESLPDFALARFPVTMGEYIEWLETLGEAEVQRRVCRDVDGEAYLVRDEGRFRVAEQSQSRRYVSVADEERLPVFGVTWFSALAYAAYRARVLGRSLRLPTALEWRKAMAGADGRPLPMGTRLDPSFAKVRQSRPEGPIAEPVGAFPLDESPYGVRDLAGGVGDWTSTMADGGAPPTAADEDLVESHARLVVWIGGNWGSMGDRPASVGVPQQVGSPSSGVGFRLALPLEGPSSSLAVEPLR